VLERQGHANAVGADTAPPSAAVPETVESAAPDDLATLAPNPADPSETLAPVAGSVPQPAAPAATITPEIAAPELTEPVESSAADVIQSNEPLAVAEAEPDPSPFIAETLLPTSPLNNAATVVSPITPLKGSGQTTGAVAHETITSTGVPGPTSPVSVTESAAAEVIRPVEPLAVAEAESDPRPLIAETLLPTSPLNNSATMVSPVTLLEGAGQTTGAVPRETITSTGVPAPTSPVSVTALAPSTAENPAQASVSVPRPSAPPSEQDLAVGDLIARIRATPAEDCLLALPRRDGTDGVGLELVAASEPGMARFADDLLTEAESAIRQTRTVIDPRQCAALGLMQNNRDYPATRLGITMDMTEIPSGGQLTGTVRGTAGRYVLLLLIDNNGVVQDLQRFLAFSGNVVRFDVPVTRAGPVRDTSQLILVIASDKPFATIQSRNGQLAADVFSSVDEANGRAASMGFATFDVQ